LCINGGEMASNIINVLSANINDQPAGENIVAVANASAGMKAWVSIMTWRNRR